MRITWLLSDELAVGTAPCSHEDLDRLEQEGVRVLISLCSAEEAPCRAPSPSGFSGYGSPCRITIITALPRSSRSPWCSWN
ncbi:hypothetical protein AAJV73_08145 [Cyanobium sp. BSA11S]|uniref:hypothetical protein n=1 Tax=Cyanobium sp. BSA11S TaxID=3108224 RepID=UPI003D813D91